MKKLLTGIGITASFLCLCLGIVSACVFYFKSPTSLIGVNSLLEQDEKHTYLRNLYKKNGKDWYVSFASESVNASKDPSLVAAILYVAKTEHIQELQALIDERCLAMSADTGITPVQFQSTTYNLQSSSLTYFCPCDSIH